MQRHQESMHARAAYILITWIVWAGGCSVNNPLQKTFDASRNDATYTITGAEDRAIVTTAIGPYSRPGLVDPNSITCTEPSPDVAKAIATVASLAAEVAGKGAIGFSAAQTESIAQLAERTVAVQLFRDKMYQTCLAYQNGAISGVTYTLIMSRLDDAIVTLMMGEAAAGAFGRAGAALAVSGGGEASLSSIGNELNGADKTADKVTSVREDLATQLEEQKQLQTKCGAAIEAEGKKPEGDRKPRDELESCKQLDETSAKVRETEGLLKSLTETLQSEIRLAVKATTDAKEARAIGGLSQTPSQPIAAVLENMQSNFFDYDLTLNVIPACLVELGLENTAPNPAAIYAEAVLEPLYRMQNEIRDGQSKLEELEKTLSTETGGARRGVALEIDQLTQELSRLRQSEREYIESAPQVPKTLDLKQPYEMIFSKLLKDWSTQRPPALKDMEVYLAEIRGVSAMMRRSSLAIYCGREMGRLVQQLGKNIQSLRKLRLQYQAAVDIERTRGEHADQVANLYKEFSVAMERCMQLEEKLRPACRSALAQWLEGEAK